MKFKFFVLVFLVHITPNAFAQSMPNEMPGMDMEGDNGHMMMSPMYGDYIHTRESSGTSWQPDSSPMEGWHFNSGDWSFMAHGAVYGIYDKQGGNRGAEKGYSSNMGMFMGTHPLGDGTLGFRTMVSLDPFMGKSGYPELLQTGETANGQDELVDRQHPHDLFMELALTYSLPITKESSIFLYGGLPGEPAIGPTAFMHRASGSDIPDAPITHHWLDSTHITEGVLTTGYIYKNWKAEGSLFNGREPDEDRYNIETRKLDSWSGRLTYNPADNWSTQISYAYLNSPEQIAPGVEVQRITASATYNLPIGENNWATTFAWGRNENNPGKNLNGYLLESEFLIGETHTIFSRLENVDKDELFSDEESQAGQKFNVNRAALGYIYDFPKFDHIQFGVGGEGAAHFLSDSLESSYGETPVSFFLFVRAKLR